MNSNKTFLIVEIALAKKLVSLAKKTSFDAVKFQR